MIKLLSHLSHVRLAAADVEASVLFYSGQLGLREVYRDHGSVYLRTSDDFYLFSLVVEPGPEPALVSLGWRTVSEAALDEAAERVQSSGVEGQWRQPAFGRGRSFVFTGPWGHTMELFAHAEKFRPPQHAAEAEAGTADVRALDHVTIATTEVTACVTWHSDVLGLQLQPETQLDSSDITVYAVLGTNAASRELGVVLDSSSRPGRINHVAYRLDTRQALLDAAPALTAGGVRIEHGPSTHLEYGPSIHVLGEQNYLYVREPSGLRVELTTGGFLPAVPDRTPALWRPSPGPGNFYLNARMPLSMTEGFPPDGSPTATEEGLVPGTETRLVPPIIPRRMH
ncbi:VOC family protein [Cryobacterium psychrophilum]|uniref:Catechol 1,2-dioxygenase n=1 Tax=Cryobacterium psychrophilum TaxID=41988 RepID=A0A4Y8KX81_9MICO|nr:VOC family protein [Cryobacterium psychrophilum]TDW29393.1 catechol 2,3-dioxygenase [Cryobacterium psychrophilum]TFD81462.1 catechol 1,2-dioxygenase [Cryobacterium psychrophilum]